MLLPLKTGDPYTTKDGASFTRFVLPFAYRLEPINGSPEGLRYELKSETPEYAESTKWRRRYFTGETSESLFGRAAWGESSERSQEFSLHFRGGGEPKTLCMSPPKVVLFERAVGSRSDRDATSCDLLRTGFLVVELFFPGDQSVSLDDFLDLNELFRYRREPYPGHLHRKEAYLLRREENRGELQRIFSQTHNIHCVYCRWEELLSIPIKTGDNCFYRLFPEEWKQCGCSDQLRTVRNGSGRSDRRRTWDIYADDRTFVWTCALIGDKGAGGGQMLAKAFRKKCVDAHDFGHWIKLLNVDAPGGTPEGTDARREFERKWAEERTFYRWAEYGTYHGFNYHSGAMLAAPSEELPLHRYFGEMYFDMILLLLYLRVTLFRFSNELFAISADARGGTSGDAQQLEWAKRFDELRWDFTLFTNLYQFPLISNQQQGVESYALARKHMDVDDLYKEVHQEINNSHEFLLQRWQKTQAERQQLQAERQQEQTEMTTLLTVVAFVGLLFSVAFAFFSLKFVEEWAEKKFLFGYPRWEWLPLVITSIAFTLLLGYAVRSSAWLAERLKQLAKLKPRDETKK